MISKNKKNTISKVDNDKFYSLSDAISLIKDVSFAKFDESVDLSFKLNVDPRHAEENIRVTTPLPHGLGKDVVVLVIANGPKEKEAADAGADFVGNKEYLDKIKGGWTDIDKIVATPDMMPQLAQLGKILGPKGLMPNPKSGTVTMNISESVKNLKMGQVELRVEKNGIVHLACGRLSFSDEFLFDNITKIYSVLIKSRPSSVKGSFIENMYLSSTMGPGIKIEHLSLG